MKYFVIEGTLNQEEEVNDTILKEHMDYTQRAIDQGLILMSTLKTDMSGGLFIMKSESIDKLEEFIATEPFKLAGIQDYKVIEITPHYLNQTPLEWFNY